MRRFVLLVGGALIAVLTACAPTVTTPAGRKPLIVGLIDKGSETAYHQGVPYPVVDTSGVAAHSPAFGGIVVNQTWSQLEPNQGTFDFTTLDASLARVASYNAQHGDAPLGVRLRVFAAYAAPGWAKTLDGTPITVPANLPSNTGGTLGQWWKPNYRAAWAVLQQALASRYDTNPVLRDVAVSSCSSLTAEPFVIGAVVVPLASADGWTPAAQQACLDGAIADYASWAHTAIYYPANPLDGDSSISDEVMQRCAHSVASGGPWCIVANNALSPGSATTGRSAPVYAEMNTLWAESPSTTPIALQMNGPDNATYCAAIGVAVSHHAQSVEVWPAAGAQAGYTTVPTSTLLAWSNALRITGISPTCPS
ncbi:MAG: beta-galactosidase [Actinomycetota bacterium]|nr:beta-galactosidase [Actinomycetota bacterium]